MECGARATNPRWDVSLWSPRSHFCQIWHYHHPPGPDDHATLIPRAGADPRTNIFAIDVNITINTQLTVVYTILSVDFLSWNYCSIKTLVLLSSFVKFLLMRVLGLEVIMLMWRGGAVVRTAGAVLEASTFAGCPLATERRECLIELRHITTTTWLVDDDWRRRHRHVLRLLVLRLLVNRLSLTLRKITGAWLAATRTRHYTSLSGHCCLSIVIVTHHSVPVHRFTGTTQTTRTIQ